MRYNTCFDGRYIYKGTRSGLVKYTEGGDTRSELVVNTDGGGTRAGLVADVGGGGCKTWVDVDGEYNFTGYYTRPGLMVDADEGSTQLD